MTGYTKGPWTTGPAFVVKAVTKDDQGRTVTNWVAECPKSGANPIEQAYANARLISAAPDMYEALKMSAQGLENMIELGLFVPQNMAGAIALRDAVRAALAKAEGKA